jgi:hypothetical protein
MAHSRSKPRRPSQPRMSFFAQQGRDLEIEARMIVAWLWGLLKMGLESMLRFGLRSDITATTVVRPRGLPGITPLRPNSREGADRKGVSPGRMPKRFLAARHGDE